MVGIVVPNWSLEGRLVPSEIVSSLVAAVSRRTLTSMHWTYVEEVVKTLDEGALEHTFQQKCKRAKIDSSYISTHQVDQGRSIVRCKPRIFPRRRLVESNLVIALQRAFSGIVLVVGRAIRRVGEEESAIRVTLLHEAWNVLQ